MILELSGDYLKAEDVKGGEIVTFRDAGVGAELTSPEGKVKKVINFKIELLINGKEEAKSYTPNRTALELFVKAWGKDTSVWIGKQFKINLIKVNVFGTLKDSIAPEILAGEQAPINTQTVETVKM